MDCESHCISFRIIILFSGGHVPFLAQLDDSRKIENHAKDRCSFERPFSRDNGQMLHDKRTTAVAGWA